MLVCSKLDTQTKSAWEKSPALQDYFMNQEVNFGTEEHPNKRKSRRTSG